MKTRLIFALSTLLAASSALASTPPREASRTLKKTLCMEMTDNKAEGSFTVTFEGSRMLMHLSKSDAIFEKTRIDLIDACQDRKAVNVTFDTQSLKITKLQIIKAKKKKKAVK